jgi:F-type H+-transporting ATPase subunit a
MILAGAAHDPNRIDILHHLMDSDVYVHVADLPFGISLDITKHVLLIWAAALILLVVMTIVGRHQGLVPRGIRNLFEPVLLFIHDELAVPNFHDKAARYVPFLWTVFFFILMCNLIGLIPGSATPTGNLSVTAGLALISFCAIHYAGVRENGLGHYLAAIVPPVPWWLWPLLLVVEIVGIFAKPFALAVRLWANMNGGHIVILVIMGFIFLFKSPLAAGISVAAATAIYMLELFVALLQAYVFTFLTAVFMGMAANPEH